jgi:hypothetical protein
MHPACSPLQVKIKLDTPIGDAVKRIFAAIEGLDAEHPVRKMVTANHLKKVQGSTPPTHTNCSVPSYLRPEWSTLHHHHDFPFGMLRKQSRQHSALESRQYYSCKVSPLPSQGSATHYIPYHNHSHGLTVFCLGIVTGILRSVQLGEWRSVG